MAMWRLNFNRMLTPLFGRTGVIQRTLATKSFADACRATLNEAKDNSAATTGLWTEVSLTLMLQVTFSFQGPYRIRLVWCPRSFRLKSGLTSYLCVLLLNYVKTKCL